MTRRAAVALVAALVLAGCGSTGGEQAQTEPSPVAPPATALDPVPSPTVTPEPAEPPAPSTAPPAEPTPRTAQVRRAGREAAAPPVAVVLPTIEISADVVPVEVGDDGVLDVPPDPRVVGWWADGAMPGQGRGAVVLDVHLDSRTYGKGPFARATDLVVGDPLTVVDEADRKRHYVVGAVETYEKERLPYETLFAQDGPERVVLVTCGGVYRPDQGGWDSNVVVTFVRL